MKIETNNNKNQSDTCRDCQNISSDRPTDTPHRSIETSHQCRDPRGTNLVREREREIERVREGECVRERESV